MTEHPRPMPTIDSAAVSAKATSGSHLTARALRATLARVALALFRVRALDMERVPRTGGAILAGNHVSYADPVLLWCRAPRQVHFMAKVELWRNPVFAWGLPKLWAFPVRRGEADRSAIATATGILKAGGLVGVFPEGTRHRDGREGLGEGQEGAAFMALRAGVPIVPVGIAGTERILPEGSRLVRFPRVTMCFGDPVSPADFDHLGKRERLSAMTAAVMDGIAGELERARGRG